MTLHPGQIALDHDMFSPSQRGESGRSYRGGLSSTDGQGALLKEGEMIDEVSAKAAREILALTRRA